MIKIVISKEYTKSPGGRNIKHGDFSGEDFRNKVLKPAYLKAKANNEKIVVDLDGVYGYATSFLEEAFGGLVRETKDKSSLGMVEIISNDSPHWVKDIRDYMEDALKGI